MSDNRIVVRNIPDQKIPVKNDVPIYLNSTIVKKIITSNGTYRAAEEKANGYDPVVVDVPTYEAENVALTAEVAELTETVAAKTAEITQLEAEVGEAYEQGKQAEWSVLWDSIQNFGNKVDYTGTFRDKGWTDETFNPKYPIKPTTADYTFVDTGITDFTREGIVLDFSLTTVARGTFRGTRNTEMKLPTIDFSKVAYSSENFRNFWGKELSLILPETFNYSTSFLENYYLENLTISGVIGSSINLRDSRLLSAESIQCVIDCLKDLTGATAQTLTFHKDVGAKLTDTQKATITAKNWTLVY